MQKATIPKKFGIVLQYDSKCRSNSILKQNNFFFIPFAFFSLFIFVFFCPFSSFNPLSLTPTLSLHLSLLVSLGVQWWPACGGSPYGKVTVVVFFLQSHCVVRLYLGFEEIGFEFMRFVGYEKIECLIWEWD